MKLITTSALHELPEDMKVVLKSDDTLGEKWNALTDIARNEWICWVTIYTKEETRTKHLARMREDLLAGEKRPCCWPGCPHRNPKAAQYFPKSFNL